MKRLFYTLLGITCISTMSFFSCKKTDQAVSKPKEELIVGKWSINRVQLKFFYGGILVKDSIVPPAPQPENFVSFTAAASFEYRFNKPTSDVGTYTFAGTDSIYASLGASIPNLTSTGKWYNQLLTVTNFNVIGRGTSTLYPGGYVDIYQSFVR
jgi:hypothetical protein